eukprot:15465005-Alexandrium_andersonii.AAC.1
MRTGRESLPRSGQRRTLQVNSHHFHPHPHLHATTEPSPRQCGNPDRPVRSRDPPKWKTGELQDALP